MRLLFASVATLAAVAFAAPVFAQDATPAAPTTSAPTPTPTTTTKHKPATNTVAYCNTLKSSTSKSACLKRVHAQHAQNATSKAGTAHKKTKKVDTTKAATSASAAPAPTPAPAPAPSGPQTINVPPLPQKTI
jgi:cobalamin-dependent methionine synthase I